MYSELAGAPAGETAEPDGEVSVGTKTATPGDFLHRHERGFQTGSGEFHAAAVPVFARGEPERAGEKTGEMDFAEVASFQKGDAGEALIQRRGIENTRSLQQAVGGGAKTVPTEALAKTGVQPVLQPGLKSGLDAVENPTVKRLVELQFVAGGIGKLPADQPGKPRRAPLQLWIFGSGKQNASFVHNESSLKKSLRCSDR